MSLPETLFLAVVGLSIAGAFSAPFILEFLDRRRRRKS